MQEKVHQSHIKETTITISLTKEKNGTTWGGEHLVECRKSNKNPSSIFTCGKKNKRRIEEEEEELRIIKRGIRVAEEGI